MNCKAIFALFIISLFVLFISNAYSQDTQSLPVSNLKIAYFKDGEGIFVYDLATKNTVCIYKPLSPTEYFLPERLISYRGYIIFGIYNSIDGYKPYEEWQERYYFVNKNGGETQPYSTLIFKEKGRFRMRLSLREDFYGKESPSIFANFPKDIEYAITQTGGSPQLHALFKSVDSKCVFISGDTKDGTPDKTIRMWDLASNKIKVILEFCEGELPLSHGGGGYAYPYLLNATEVIFEEFPRERGFLSVFGMGQNSWCYLKSLDLKTGKVTVIDKLKPAGAWPKISPCGNYIVYEAQEICLKDIKSGEITKIGKGHSPFWLN